MAMKQTYDVVYEGGSDEIVEKKSRFIAHVFPVHSEQEAVEHIEQIRKQYWDARHNCHAFVIGPNDEISRCSDDGRSRPELPDARFWRCCRAEEYIMHLLL